MPLTCSTRFLLMLWRRLTLPAILGLVLAAYAVDWLTVVAQFHKSGLMTRMSFAAQLLAVDQPDASKAKDQIRAISGTAATQPAGPLFGAPADAIAKLDGATLALATTRPTSTDYSDAFRKWSKAAADATNGMASPPPATLKAYVLNDKYLEAGAGAHPYGGALDRRVDAAMFLDDYHAFERFSIWHQSTWDALNDLPLTVRLRPWLLHRFYDRKHFELCENIPLAIAALLLACSFLLRFLFADYDPRAATGCGLPPRHAGPQALWDEIDGPSPFHPIGTRASSAGRPSHARLWGAAAHFAGVLEPFLPWIGLLTMLCIEVAADRPETSVSWWFKIPTIGLAGLLIPVVWITVGRLCAMRFAPQWLTGNNRPFLSRVLRPFTFGTAALLFVTAWAGTYSVFALLTSDERGAVVRGLLQTAAVAYTFIGLWWLAVHLNRQFKAPATRPGAPPSPSASTSSAPATDAGDDNTRFNILSGVFPGLEEVTLRAILLALIPLPEMIKLFS